MTRARATTDGGLALVDLLVATMVTMSAAALAVPLTSNLSEAEDDRDGGGRPPGRG